MDSPIFVALFVFLGIFFLFFVVSLVSDLLILVIVLLSAALAYMIPEMYDAEYFQQILQNQLAFMEIFGVSFPAQLDTATHYILGAMIIFGGMLLCVPILPFSAIYRQMLGANKISGRDEIHVKRIVAEELEMIRQRIAAEKHKRHHQVLQRKIQPDEDEDEEDLDLVDERPTWRDRFHRTFGGMPRAWRKPDEVEGERE